MESPELVRALGNKYSVEILQTADKPYSAQELSDELSIPIATSYRRVNELAEVGLLELTDRRLTDGNQRVKAYKRTVDDIHIHFGDSLIVSTEPQEELDSRLDKAWRKLVGERSG